MALGIIAGRGVLPLKVALKCKEEGKDFFVVALKGAADISSYQGMPSLEVRLGEFGKILKAFKKAHVKEIVIIGGVQRPSFKELLPDLRGLKFFAKVGTSFTGDNDLLSLAVQELELEGFKVVGIHTLLPELMTPKGVLTKTSPSKEQAAFFEKGIHLAKEIGHLDIGQAVVLQKDLVLGVEGIEGTDALISRTAGLKRKEIAPVLFKVCKPNQEQRVDLPASGLKTLENLYQNGFAGLVLEAGATLMADKEEMIAFANKHKLFIVGF